MSGADLPDADVQGAALHVAFLALNTGVVHALQLGGGSNPGDYVQEGMGRLSKRQQREQGATLPRQCALAAMPYRLTVQLVRHSCQRKRTDAECRRHCRCKGATKPGPSPSVPHHAESQCLELCVRVLQRWAWSAPSCWSPARRRCLSL